jgi:hypothetical protein
VAGALLSLGDAHAAQGDSELDGTAIETSINARLKITLHKKDKLPKLVQVARVQGLFRWGLVSVPGGCAHISGADTVNTHTRARTRTCTGRLVRPLRQ